MNAPLRQESRVGRLTTDLGKDVLVILRLNGSDGMNQLFEYEVEALSTQPGLDFNALIGTHATVEIQSYHHGRMPFDGIVTRASWVGVGENGHKYSMTLRPWFWLAGKRRNQRIFHEKTVVEIIEEVLKPYSGLGDPHLENRLQNDYRNLEYTVQYRESDLAFVTRLMERFGISYHFGHKVGSHSLVLTDTIDQHDTVPGSNRPYRGVDGHHHANEEHFWEWSPERNLTTGAIRLTDWNFKTPTVAMEVDKLGDASYEQGQLEAYDFPGDYLEPGVGKSVVSLRVDQERAQDARLYGLGDCTSLKAGMVLSLTGEELKDATGKKYLCLGATHSFVAESYGTGGTESDGYAYSGQYVFAPADAPLAPERVTARPIVHGPQTAMVVGEGEIDCDEFGRILVHFPWDLAKAYSMRCRVSQNWAHNGWGGMVIPRIGMEVVVEFIEGDPDMPLVTGCVYNGKNDPPYPLPEHKTKSVFRSDTHQGDGFNEFMFEDQNGEEKIYLHAEKDHELHIENNRAKRVDNNQSESVGHNKSIEVGNNHHEVIGGNMTVMVGPNKLQSMVTNAFSKFTGKIGALANRMGFPDLMNMGEGNMIIGVGKNKAETVMLSSTEIVGAAKALTVGGGMQTTVGGVLNESIAVAAWQEVGNNKVTHVGEKYEIIVGKSSIIMDREGNIQIEGVNITINGETLIKGEAPDIEWN